MFALCIVMFYCWILHHLRVMWGMSSGSGQCAYGNEPNPMYNQLNYLLFMEMNIVRHFSYFDDDVTTYSLLMEGGIIFCHVSHRLASRRDMLFILGFFSLSQQSLQDQLTNPAIITVDFTKDVSLSHLAMYALHQFQEENGRLPAVRSVQAFLHIVIPKWGEIIFVSIYFIHLCSFHLYWMRIKQIFMEHINISTVFSLKYNIQKFRYDLCFVQWVTKSADKHIHII